MTTSRLDLVLINPRSRPDVYQSLGDNLTAVENPVWAGLIATFCLHKGLSVEIIDAEAEQLGHTEVADRVKYLNPVLAAVVVYGHQPSASTQIMTGSGHDLGGGRGLVPIHDHCREHGVQVFDPIGDFGVS